MGDWIGCSIIDSTFWLRVDWTLGSDMNNMIAKDAMAIWMQSADGEMNSRD